MPKYLSLNWLLLAIPGALWIHYTSPDSHTAVFVLSCISIIPLAGWMGRATEHLAEKTGEGVGGLLNATFGNAAELIIALVALQKGLADVVKASLTGSIIGNVLLVLGLSLCAGGCKHREQVFNATGARSQSSMLMLAGIAMLLPAVFHHVGGANLLERERSLSFDISIILLITYAFSLWFSLRTHKDLFSGAAADIESGEHVDSEHWSVKKSITILLVATAAIAWMSEILVGSVEHAAHNWGMTSIFIGVIVVAIIGNAAEHSTAILVALKNRMDLSLSIALGSSIQIALFVAPVLVFASYLIAPQPMDLVFSMVEVVAVFVSVMIAGQISGDGRSNWFEGVQLLSVYIILGIVFYFLPEVVGTSMPVASH